MHTVGWRTSMFKDFKLHDLFVWFLFGLVIYCSSPMWIDTVDGWFGQPTKAELKVANQVKTTQLAQLTVNNEQQSQVIRKQVAIQNKNTEVREQLHVAKQTIVDRKVKQISEFRKKIEGPAMADSPLNDDDQALAMLALVEEGYQSAIGNTPPEPEGSEDTHFENKESEHV